MFLLQKQFFFISAIFRKFFYKTLARHFIYSYEAQTQAKPGWHHPSRVFCFLAANAISCVWVGTHNQYLNSYPKVLVPTLRNVQNGKKYCSYNRTLHLLYGIVRVDLLDPWFSAFYKITIIYLLLFKVIKAFFINVFYLQKYDCLNLQNFVFWLEFWSKFLKNISYL